MACLLAYLWPRAQSFAGGSDSSGYLHNAKLLLDGRLEIPYRAIGELPYEALRPQTYTPLGFKMNPESGLMRPTYPFGLPLVVAAVGSVVGLEFGAHLAIVGIALFTLWGMFALARDVTGSGWWAAGSAAVLAACPLFVFMAVALMADVLSTGLACWILWGALRLEKSAWGAVGLGALFSLLVLARSPNLFFAIPVAVALGPRLRRPSVAWGILAGGAPGAIFLLVTNHLLYGSAFTTGYGDLGKEFAWANVPKSAAMYAEWVPKILSPIVAVGFALSLRLAWTRPRLAWALWLWIACFFGFYASYSFTSEVWWYLRFALPAFPAVILCASLGLEALLSMRWRPWRWMAGLPYLGIGLIAWALALQWKWLETLVNHGPRAEDSYVLMSEWAEEALPGDAVVACMQLSGHVLYGFDNPILRYDWVTTEDWEAVSAEAKRLGIEIFAPLFRFEIDDVKALERMPGDWELVADRSSCSIYRLRQ